LAQVLSLWSIWANLSGLEKHFEIFESVMEKPVERRKHRRFEVQEGAFAGLGHRFTPVGQIMDIGKGGLSFRYVAEANESNGLSELQIVASNRNTRFDKAPCKPIWDLEIPYAFSGVSITMRQCGVQFGELTAGWVSQLEYFIQNHTTDEVDR
jgi:hypothetical protein